MRSIQCNGYLLVSFKPIKAVNFNLTSTLLSLQVKNVHLVIVLYPERKYMAKFSNILLFSGANIEQSAAIKLAAELANDNQATLTVCAIIGAVPNKSHVAYMPKCQAFLILMYTFLR